MLTGTTRRPSSGGRPARGPNEESRSRTFTGCRTCRNRHLKCDEAKPKCSTCRRGNIPCEGYAPRLLWMSEQPTNPDAARGEERNAYRYPLFSEKVRSSMSLELVGSLGNQSAGRALIDIDNESFANNPREYRSAGPFGVFRAFDDPSNCEQTLHSCLPPAQSDQSGHVTHPAGGNMTSAPVDHPQETANCGHTQFEAVQSSSALDEDPENTFTTDLAVDIEDWIRLGPQFCGSSPALFSFDNLAMDAALPPISSPGPLFLSRSTPKGPETPHYYPPVEGHDLTVIENTEDEYRLQTIPRSVPVPTDSNGSRALPAHAAELLRYLRTEVLGGPRASSTRLSPWRKLMLPRALETFAELSLWNTTSHTRLGILCSILSKSAYHLHRSAGHDSQQSSRWREVAVNHRHEAQKHLKKALSTEVGGSESAEYTELLMAMLGVCFVSMYFDGARAVKSVLLDAEHVIRLRGFPSRKSLGLRVLHHMYTHLRVIMESTNFPSLSPVRASPRLGHVDSSTTTMTLPSGFHVNESRLGDLDTLRDKPDEVGYYDIHLDVSGHWPLTLYPDIYGIPESLMTLHSQTISLVNEKPKLDAAALTNPAKSIALTQHIRTLEQQIWSWKMQESGIPEGPERPDSLVTVETPFYDKPDNKLLVLAIHEAVIIYFYRRVYNMSAMMLQDRVQKTLDYIQPYIEIGNYDQDFSISVGWAVFIASCEAVTQVLQERAMECLEAMDGHGVFIEASEPSSIVKTVWEQRRQSGDFTFSWPDIMVQATLS